MKVSIMKTSKPLRGVVACALFLVCIFSSCRKEGSERSKIDQNKPIIFSDYSPKQGAVRTQFYITGSNFGNDPSKIEVFIGETALKVIGSTGDKVYCMVPQNTKSGKVKVIVKGEGDANLIEYTFPDEFNYKATVKVGTLAGKVNHLGQSSRIDGTFEEAEFGYPSWIQYEPHTNVLFVVEPNNSIRKVDFETRTVSTLVTNSQANFSRLQTASLSSGTDTLFLVDDNTQIRRGIDVTIAYTLRSENFRRVHPYINDRGSFSCMLHPVDKVMFFNTWWGGAVMKAYHDPVISELNSKEMFRLGGNNNMLSTMFFHPSGNYAYFLSGSCVYKSTYNWSTKELSAPIVFAGSQSEQGDIDAIGTLARFQGLFQGVFVKNESNIGKEDEYDFYLADISNHSIRRISPTGEVQTFAGKGSPSSDGTKHGYIDGEPRLEARFDQPSGIAYDEKRKIFFISERENKRIRTIHVE